MTLLTISEAASSIRMSTGWIKLAIRSGKLKALHFGRSVRIRPEDLEAYIASVGKTKVETARQWRMVR